MFLQHNTKSLYFILISLSFTFIITYLYFYEIVLYALSFILKNNYNYNNIIIIQTTITEIIITKIFGSFLITICINIYYILWLIINIYIFIIFKKHKNILYKILFIYFIFQFFYLNYIYLYIYKYLLYLFCIEPNLYNNIIIKINLQLTFKDYIFLWLWFSFLINIYIYLPLFFYYFNLFKYHTKNYFYFICLIILCIITPPDILILFSIFLPIVLNFEITNFIILLFLNYKNKISWEKWDLNPCR